MKSVVSEAIWPGVLQYPGDDNEGLHEGVFITSIIVGSTDERKTMFSLACNE